MMASKAKVNGRPAFLVLKTEIQAELDAGVFATRIYAKFKDKLPFSYRQFLYYVDQYGLRGSALSAPDAAAKPRLTIDAPRSVPQAGNAPIGTRPDQPRKFIFNPADIDKKKLI